MLIYQKEEVENKVHQDENEEYKEEILITSQFYLYGVHPVAFYYHTFQIYLQLQLRLFLLYFFTSQFG
jgi:hypothetical protein